MANTEYKTCVVRQTLGGNKVSYWLHMSPVASPPTEGHKMSRQALKELRTQIDDVLSGEVTRSGHVWDSTDNGLQLKKGRW